MNKRILVIFLVGGLLFSQGHFCQAADDGYAIKGGRVYLNLKEAEIKNVLSIFAQATRTNIVTADDVVGKVTVSFSGIEPMEGLTAVLRSNGLDWYKDVDGTIYVSKGKVMKTFYLDNARPSEIQTIIKDILPEGSKVSVDDTYNALVVQTASDNLMRVEKLIDELDVSPTQVMIEVKMIEVKHTDGGNTGVDISYANPEDVGDTVQTVNLAGQSDATDAQGLYAHVLKGSVESYLSAIKTAATYDTIATPRITTISNKEAQLLIGAKLGYKVAVIGQTTSTEDVKFLEVGTSLKLTPHVGRSGYIRMEVAPKISDGTITNNIPNENTTETKNEVIVKDGQTFVIGGLMKDKDTEANYGIPFIMDIPYLGTFFRKTVITKEKQELLVFVTPHILSNKLLDSMEDDIKRMEDLSAKKKARLIH